MPSPKQNLLGRIPSVEILLQEVESEGWTAGVPRRTLVDSMRAAVDHARMHLLEGAAADADSDGLRRTILADAQQTVQAAVQPHYRKVINATGIILHTGLGRAVIPANALRRSRRNCRATPCSRWTSPAANARRATGELRSC